MHLNVYVIGGQSQPLELPDQLTVGVYCVGVGMLVLNTLSTPFGVAPGLLQMPCGKSTCVWCIQWSSQAVVVCTVMDMRKWDTLFPSLLLQQKDVLYATVSRRLDLPLDRLKLVSKGQSLQNEKHIAALTSGGAAWEVGSDRASQPFAVLASRDR